jgi:hypothetical protein
MMRATAHGSWTGGEVDDQVDRVAVGEGRRRAFEARAVEPGLAVCLGGGDQRPEEGTVAAGRHGHTGDVGDAAHAARVQGRFLECLVARDGRDRAELDLGVAVSEEYRHRVVVPGVAVEDDPARHRPTLGQAATGHRSRSLWTKRHASVTVPDTVTEL